MNISACAGVVVDIEAELAHWQQHYRSATFHRQDFNFKDYVASLKFAYDAYLRWYRQPLESMLPELHRRYGRDIPAREQLDWQRMAGLLAAVWERLQRRGAENALAANATAAGDYRDRAATAQRSSPRLESAQRTRSYPWIRGLANVNLKEAVLEKG